MAQNRVTPYQRLKDTLRAYADEVESRKEKFMWRYPRGHSYTLDDLAERVAAADQLGFDVILRKEGDGLHVIYRQKAPARPWEAKW